MNIRFTNRDSEGVRGGFGFVQNLIFTMLFRFIIYDKFFKYFVYIIQRLVIVKE